MQRPDKPWLYVLAVMIGGIGIIHFVNPAPFLKIMPPMLPEPLLLVYVSGFFEIAGAIGLVVPKTRRAAAWGLVALFVAVFPANIYQAIAEIPYGDVHNPLWAWLRLPLQPLLIYWAWLYTRPQATVPAANLDASTS